MAEKRGLSPLMALPPLVFALFAALFFFGVTRDDPDALPSVMVGQPAPALDLGPFEGTEMLTRADLDAGGPKLVNFWASWCAPCRLEHPLLEALADEGVVVYGINFKDKPAQAGRFLAELGNPYARLGTDAQGRAALDWGVYGVPETFVLDGDGTVLMRHAGPLTEKVVAERLRPALEGAAR